VVRGGGPPLSDLGGAAMAQGAGSRSEKPMTPALATS
jgi:hypothetical protein